MRLDQTVLYASKLVLFHICTRSTVVVHAPPCGVWESGMCHDAKVASHHTGTDSWALPPPDEKPEELGRREMILLAPCSALEPASKGASPLLHLLKRRYPSSNTDRIGFPSFSDSNGPPPLSRHRAGRRRISRLGTSASSRRSPAESCERVRGCSRCRRPSCFSPDGRRRRSQVQGPWTAC